MATRVELSSDVACDTLVVRDTLWVNTLRAAVSIVDGAEFALETITINARPGGSDSSGNGSASSPYATLVRAARDVQPILAAGRRVIVDSTDVTEVLPDNYTFPAWKAPRNIGFTPISDPYFLFSGAVDIRALPRLTTVVSAADATIAAADILSSVQDPVTQLVTITLNVPRPSWAGNALKGKLVIGTFSVGANCTVAASTATTLLITNTAAPTTPIQIMEPSCSLSGTDSLAGPGFGGALNAYNCDSISFSGIKIASTGAGNGLYAAGQGMTICQLCELTSPYIATVNNGDIGGGVNRVVRNWVKGTLTGFTNSVLLQSLFDAGVISMRAPNNFGIARSVFDGCNPIELVSIIPSTFGPAAPGFFGINQTLVRNGPGDGIRYHGSSGRFNRVDVYGNGGHGVVANTGNGYLELNNVRSSGALNLGAGVRVDDVQNVKVDAATSAVGAAPTGLAGDMIVGGGAARTWANFLSGADFRPIKTEYDITAAAATGATGSGARLYQP